VQGVSDSNPRVNARLKHHCRRALELLASSQDGATQAILLAHGITVAQMVELARTGLTSVTSERLVAGGRTVVVARVRITEAGRRMLAR
jgi:hypothetical protein